MNWKLPQFEQFYDIEEKVPSIWSTWEEAGIACAQAIAFTWDIKDAELIHSIAIISYRVPGLKITKHVDPMLSFAMLYPAVMVKYDRYGNKYNIH